MALDSASSDNVARFAKLHLADVWDRVRAGFALRGGAPECPAYEYEYVDQYLKRSAAGLLRLDLTIIGRGVKVMLKGKGL